MDNSRSEDKGKKRVYPRPKRTTTSEETGESSKQSGDGDKNGETTTAAAAAAGSSSSNTQVPTEEATKYGYYSFPPFPDSEPEEEEAALPPKPSGPDESPSLATRVRSFFRTPSGETKTEQKHQQQPPRTGVFLWCKHAFEEPCRCRNQLPPGDRGDYCEWCLCGACPGPAISIPRSVA